jgi:lipid A 3-O-deacylase
MPLARRRFGRWFAAAAAAAMLAPAAARAQSSLTIIDEIKLGVLDHDVQFLGGKEGGADINGEVLFRSPVKDATAQQVTPYLRWLVQPRLHVGFEANTSGFTNQFYFGGTWTWLLARQLARPGDSLNFGISFGPSFNDGDIVSRQPDRKNLGSNVLFREGFELGYLLTPRYEVSAFFDHVSNGGLAKYNQSINDLGMRFGIKF